MRGLITDDNKIREKKEEETMELQKYRGPGNIDSEYIETDKT